MGAINFDNPYGSSGIRPFSCRLGAVREVEFGGAALGQAVSKLKQGEIAHLRDVSGEHFNLRAGSGLSAEIPMDVGVRDGASAGPGAEKRPKWPGLCRCVTRLVEPVPTRRRVRVRIHSHFADADAGPPPVVVVVLSHPVPLPVAGVTRSTDPLFPVQFGERRHRRESPVGWFMPESVSEGDAVSSTVGRQPWNRVGRVQEGVWAGGDGWRGPWRQPVREPVCEVGSGVDTLPLSWGSIGSPRGCATPARESAN